MSARSCASCTELDDNIANPVGRTAITSLWSPKIDKRVRRHRARRHVKDRRRQLARNLVHVWDHQQQTLACRKRRREAAALQGSVNCARRSPFTLHLDDGGNAAPRFGTFSAAHASADSAMLDEGVIG